MLVLIFSKNTYASLKINEVYPAPIPGEYEWVEIYNDENTIIDLSQYSLYDLTNKKIKFTNTILQPLSFEIATSSGVLNNDGDTLSLKNNLGEIIEIATYSASFDSTKTYAKCPDFNGNWFILNLSTKNDSNETACQSLTPIPTLTITPTLTIVPTEGTENPSPTESLSYNNIYISEAMINPLIGEKEWVEIYNDNDFSVFLSNWFIDDLENTGSSPKIFSLEISEKNYAVFNLTSSMFNNDGDSVRLLDFNKNLKDDFEYQKTETGKTLGRTSLESDYFCLQEPSKSSANNLCIDPTPTITPTTNIIQTKISPIVKSAPQNKPVSINRLIDTKNLLTPVEIKTTGQVLGTSDELMINFPSNKSLINLLTILSASYSLLTIISILFKMKLLYGKNKDFYSPPLHSS